MTRPAEALAAILAMATVASASMAIASTAALIGERSRPAVASPDVLSIRIRDEDVAHDMWSESLSIGEKTCLTELNDGGLRYWLHSCDRPHFTDGGTGQ